MALIVLGGRKNSKSWMGTESWRKIKERKKVEKRIDGARLERLNNKARNDYREKDKEVKRSLKNDKKRDWINSVSHEAEDTAQQGQMKGVYEATKSLYNEGPGKVRMLKSKEGRLLTKEGEVKV